MNNLTRGAFAHFSISGGQQQGYGGYQPQGGYAGGY